MLHIPPNTALLLFARTAGAESRVKRLVRHGGPKANRRVVQQLNRRAKCIARQSGLPVVVIAEKQQVGRTFGERLAHAFEQLFAQGYERVIAIGNDCPALTPHRIRRAAAALCERPVVLGPAADGGTYLTALHRVAFDRQAFTDLPWQQPTLFAAFEAYTLALTQQPAALLPREYDADTAAALEATLRRLRGTAAWVHTLLALLFEMKPVKARFTDFSPTSFFQPAISRRGPPLPAC